MRRFFGLTMAGPTVVTHGDGRSRAASCGACSPAGLVVPALQRARRRVGPRRPGRLQAVRDGDPSG
ncbi:MAG: hypothetical protein R2746_04035 [Acidimicrobiales bacterium]